MAGGLFQLPITSLLVIRNINLGSRFLSKKKRNTLRPKLNGLGKIFCFATNLHLICRERSGSVVKCLSVTDLSLNGVTAV